MPLYATTFTRSNFNYRPPLEEKVIVIFEDEEIVSSGEDGSAVRRDEKEWSELFAQYPLWQCPYNAGKPPPNQLEMVRHGFSSPFAEKTRRL